MIKAFRDFAMRGNVVDMAVGIIIGGAFGTIIKSLVDDVLMPPIGLALGGVDFSNLFVMLKPGVPSGPYAAVADAKAAGAVTINYGLFVNSVISFTIIVFAVFLLIRSLNTMRSDTKAPAAAPAARECQYCATAIPIKATRCPHCTSQLSA